MEIKEEQRQTTFKSLFRVSYYEVFKKCFCVVVESVVFPSQYRTSLRLFLYSGGCVFMVLALDCRLL